MRKSSNSEKLILDEISEIGVRVRQMARGLSIGEFIAMIRKQLGMSQKVLSKRAKIPQSTLSRVEQGKISSNLRTIHKILDALSCDLLLFPILRERIDVQRRKQARKKAEKHIRYLKGTMSLEDQQPDSRFLEQFLIEKEEEFLHSKTKLWGDENDKV